MSGDRARGDIRTGQAQSGRITKLRLSKAEKKELLRQLAEFEMFAECSSDDIAALVDAGRPFTMPANRAIMAEGDAAGSFYAITRGHARVFHGRQQIAEVGPGEVIGEMSLLRTSAARHGHIDGPDGRVTRGHRRGHRALRTPPETARRAAADLRDVPRIRRRGDGRHPAAASGRVTAVGSGKPSVCTAEKPSVIPHRVGTLCSNRSTPSGRMIALEALSRSARMTERT